MLVLNLTPDNSVILTIRTPAGEITGRVQLESVKGRHVSMSFEFPKDQVQITRAERNKKVPVGPAAWAAGTREARAKNIYGERA